MAKISIIIPIYNTEKFLHRCIDSILVQTFSDFELILVDDGSTDNCGKICYEYERKDKRIKVFHQKNQGQAKARNIALDYVFDRMETEWIAFVDSDDWVHPQYLELLLDAVLDNQLKISTVFPTFVNSMEDDSIYSIEQFYSSVEKMEYVYTTFGIQVAGYPHGRLYYVEMWRNIRFPVGRIWEDLATIYKVLLQVDTIALVHGKIYYYFQHSESTVGGKWTPRWFDEFWAYEEQLNDKRISSNSIIYPLLKEQYITTVCNQLNLINEADLTEKERRKFKVILKQKRRYVIRKYSKETKYSFRSKIKHIYETAFQKK